MTERPSQLGDRLLLYGVAGVLEASCPSDGRWRGWGMEPPSLCPGWEIILFLGFSCHPVPTNVVFLLSTILQTFEVVNWDEFGVKLRWNTRLRRLPNFLVDQQSVWSSVLDEEDHKGGLLRVSIFLIHPNEDSAWATLIIPIGVCYSPQLRSAITI